jgi:Fur family transcriptional regulator, ferric uptake regulator
MVKKKNSSKKVSKTKESQDLLLDIRKDHLDLLVSKGYKITKPRGLILNALYNNTEKLVSAEDIFGQLKKEKVDKVTIYRVLELLESLGVVSQVSSKDGIKRYELADEHHHCHHAICEGCGVTEHIEDEEIEKALEVLAKKFKKVKFVKEHNLEFFGKCTSCKNS